MFELSPWDLVLETEPATHPTWFRMHRCQDSILGQTLWPHAHAWGIQDACEELYLPVKGWEHRVFNNCAYVCEIPLKSAEEAKEREPKMKEKLGWMVENWDKMWDDYKAEQSKTNEYFQKLDVEKARPHELRHYLEEAQAATRRAWYIHFIGMYPVCVAYLLLEQTCKRLFGIDDTDPTFKKLMQGFDNRLFETDRKMWHLSRRVLELGLKDTFDKIPETEELLSQLEQSENGRIWLRELNDFLMTDGWRSRLHVDFIDPSWVEDPTPPIETIRRYLLPGAEFTLDKAREEKAEERERVTEDLLSRIPSEEDRQLFMWILPLAQREQTFSEEHGFYVENGLNMGIRRVIMEVAKRMERAGALKKWEDVFVLTWDELLRSTVGYEWYDFTKIVERRRAKLEEWKRERPFIIGQPGELKDVLLLKIVGGAVPEPKVKADVWGIPGAGGVVEGTARVIFDLANVGEVLPGEILVTPVTDVAWTAVFGRINGVVTDQGGTLAHAAIVGREYGIPAVVGTLNASQKIKTGERIRVDGDNGVVHILE